MSLSLEQIQRLRAAIERWKNTPYMAGQCLPGTGKDGGVDCVRFGDTILQETYGLSLPPLPREAQDSAWHDPVVVSRITRLVFERFDLFSVDLKQPLMPADWLCVRAKTTHKPKDRAEQIEQRPHHIVIVGFPPNLAWHAVPKANVISCGIGGIRASFDIIKVWRSRFGYPDAK